MNALLEESKCKDIVSGMQHKSKETTRSEIKVSFFGTKCRSNSLILGGGDEISNNIGFGTSYIIQGKYTNIKQVNKYID
jgi:hypothetical protein